MYIFDAILKCQIQINIHQQSKYKLFDKCQILDFKTKRVNY